ncbi:hypothetical protein P9112_011118 [Eukaryota sp. TZLM1-RC]
MLVVCLEGVHGCGKSSLLQQFQSIGFNILDEAFMDVPSSVLHPQSLTMELQWVSHWFARLLKKKEELGNNSNNVFIADRSPFSAELYASNGHLLSDVLRSVVSEMEQLAGIKIVTVYLKVETSILWNRIQSRLLKEPRRRLYNEHRFEWMQEVLKFYENREWSYVVSNNRDLAHCLCDLVSTLTANEQEFEQSALPSPIPASVCPL